ncbi:MAG: class I mannose-6-phosphate isomerase [Bacteroidales bacterium]|nr:class I mannose-6-phosphate isomerase [Bacteroidales bacterium]
MKDTIRNTSQYILPLKKDHIEPGNYDIYPVFSILEGKIFSSLSDLVSMLPGSGTVIIDGFAGILFEQVVDDIKKIFKELHKSLPEFINIEDALLSSTEIKDAVLKFTGGDDPLFGTRTSLDIREFFNGDAINELRKEGGNEFRIIYGPGASLVDINAFLVYIDLPKNEVQFRSRAGLKTHIGTPPVNPKYDYKRNYFVDWVVLRKHMQDILAYIDLFVDGQRPGKITFIKGDDLRNTLSEISRNVFRVRPWFEPGPWGGSWLKDNINGLNKEVPNYAWSFELISPENGLILESGGLMLELSFDMLMIQESPNILGDCHEVYGQEFPIRFDYLDTYNGGNLSVQCHPRPQYIRNEFGENFTQEESYYIMDTKDDAVVFLGFNENIDPEMFRNELERSYDESIPVNIDKYVQTHPASRHDLFLIPYGTIHGSGRNNLVLEISSTPYIFTFKMYDWLRPDLDGKPRSLNIDRGMENVYFERKGKAVKDELICRPVLIDRGDDWELEHLKTHPTHLYDVHRYKFSSRVLIRTENKCHVLNLVEGESIMVETLNGITMNINYAETFILPAAAREYILINQSEKPAVVVKAFVK